MTQDRFDWNWFKSSIDETDKRAAPQMQELLDLVSEVDTAVQKAIARPTTYASERPQDYVVSILIVRCFRLFISGILLAVSGYPDVVAGVIRSMAEIWLLLLEIRSHPVETSLGYMLHSVEEEIVTMQRELDHLKASGTTTLNLPENLEVWRNFHSDLQSVARARGQCAKKIENQFSRLTIRDICRRNDIEKYYFVNYKFQSILCHGLHASLDGLVTEGNGKRSFSLGPVVFDNEAAVMDSFSHMATALILTGEILEDSDVLQWGESLTHTVESAIKNHKAKG